MSLASRMAAMLADAAGANALTDTSEGSMAPYVDPAARDATLARIDAASSRMLEAAAAIGRGEPADLDAAAAEVRACADAVSRLTSEH